MINSLFYKFLVFLLIAWVVGFFCFLLMIPRPVDISALPTADAIIVLTGGQKRVGAGFQLLKHKKSAKLFITGVGDRVRSLEEFSEHFGKLSAKDKEKIELGWEAESTKENAIEAEKWIAKNNISSIILVTANYHTLRSLMEFKKTLPNIKIITYPVVSPTIKVKEWWRYPNTAILLIKEYNKCLFLLVYNLCN